MSASQRQDAKAADEIPVALVLDQNMQTDTVEIVCIQRGRGALECTGAQVLCGLNVGDALGKAGAIPALLERQHPIFRVSIPAPP